LNPASVARRIVVCGQVQGVFFRATVRDAAVGAGACGWAANRADGTVEVWAEGSTEAVDAVVAACRAGSAGSDVQGMDVEENEPQGLDGFETR